MNLAIGSAMIVVAFVVIVAFFDLSNLSTLCVGSARDFSDAAFGPETCWAWDNHTSP